MRFSYLLFFTTLLACYTPEKPLNETSSVKALDSISLQLNDNLQNVLDTTYLNNHNSQIVMQIRKDTMLLEEITFEITEGIYIDSVTKAKTIFKYPHGTSLGGPWKSYNQDGTLKARGQSRDRFACFMNDGLFEYFNPDGSLSRTLYYHNWRDENASGCHDTIHDLTYKEYYKNGQAKFEKHFQTSYMDIDFESFYEEDDSFYDSTTEGGYATGTWHYFDENGKTTKTRIFPVRFK